MRHSITDPEELKHHDHEDGTDDHLARLHVEGSDRCRLLPKPANKTKRTEHNPDTSS